MVRNEFNQLVTEVTTDSGTIIDHVYVRDLNARIAMIPTYCSYMYHEALELFFSELQIQFWVYKD